jgi:hypothetical protein
VKLGGADWDKSILYCPDCAWNNIKIDSNDNRIAELEAENERLRSEIKIAENLVCPTCGFPVEEINRNGLYIAARCDWCNEVVHIEKE